MNTILIAALLMLTGPNAFAMVATTTRIEVRQSGVTIGDDLHAVDVVLYGNEEVIDYLDSLRHPTATGVVYYQCLIKANDSILSIVHPQGNNYDPKRIRQIYEVSDCQEG